jgi:hypothetical protein
MNEERFSCFLELIGLEDLADDNAEEFLLKILPFRDALDSLLPESGSHQAVVINDQMFIEMSGLNALLNFVQELKFRLLTRHGLYFRACFGEGELGIVNWNPTTDNVHGYDYGKLAIELKTSANKLKGIGLKAHPTLKANSNHVLFKNFFPSSLGSTKRQYISFIDVALQKKVMNGGNLFKTLKTMLESKTISEGTARFFVPLLINWARHTEITLGLNAEDDGKISEPTIEKFIISHTFTKAKLIFGMELVLFTLVDRIFGKNSDIEIPDAQAKNRIKTSLMQHTWLHKLVSDTGVGVEIPPEILSGYSKRSYAKFIGESI